MYNPTALKESYKQKISVIKKRLPSSDSLHKSHKTMKSELQIDVFWFRVTINLACSHVARHNRTADARLYFIFQTLFLMFTLFSKVEVMFKEVRWIHIGLHECILQSTAAF